MISTKRSYGFTLVEVLVASLILFLALGAGLTAYQTAMSGSQRAVQQLQILQVTELAQAHIKKAIQDRLLESEQSGEPPYEVSGLTNLMNVEIDWFAKLTQRGSAPPRFDEDSFDDVAYEPRFFIYQVTLVLRLKSREQHYTYTELAHYQQARVLGRL